MVDFIKAYPSPVNRELLKEELANGGFASIIVRHDNITIQDALVADEVAIDAIIASHDGNALSQDELVQSVEGNAKTQASAIPNWASWTETQALAWFDTNIAGNLPVANLAEANAVLADMATLQRNLVRMVIALRNKSFPDLQD